jgi:hypothetical protein
MLSLLRSAPGRLCDGITRRETLSIGTLGAAGLTLPDLLRVRAANPVKKARSCIILFLLGAPPQQETWDPKPDSPAEARGDLGVIQTATPGLLIGETLVKTSRITEKIAILRALSTDDNSHSSSGYYMSTGRPHSPMQVENARPGAPNDWPSSGGVVRKLLQPRSALPAAATLPEQSANDGNLTWPGQDAGFLGRGADPWLITCTPELGRLEVPGLELPPDMTGARFVERQNLLSALNGARSKSPASSQRFAPDSGAQMERAFEMLSSGPAQAAFHLDSESVRTRDRYGPGPTYHSLPTIPSPRSTSSRN